ncbi:histidinol-phosphatase (PHP family) [Paenibacillus sp. 1_12]|uniref:histidinol-phosphatase n=1 Tax=Paenibacillus sp. 1_12 TaxID=1566278 RepID=UPI0008E7EE30|nr:histidinol-phosphatase [Paenibacillus sp. 1_12]SFK80772.1 histidinol-phosphatase (PHP family) [Paenibacillus sp. 1_12]
MTKFDLHMHHERCGHAQGVIRDYIESAINRGLSVVGISDHSPFFGSAVDHEYPTIAMPKSEFPNYIEEVLRLQEEYKDKIDVLLGVESDFFPQYADLYRNVYAQYPFDYIIGSVHWTDGVSIFHKGRWDGLTHEVQVSHKNIYYDLISQSARSGIFQILGHIDAMKGFYPEFSDIPTAAVDTTLQVIAECGVAIEINTSGKTKDCGGWYPSDSILERALFYGVDVTFGSDAHIPERVADDWDQVSHKLKEIGFKHWVYYKKKQMQKVLL